MATVLGGLLTDPQNAFKWTMQKAKGLPRYAGWAFPAAVGGAWLIYPALSDGFKVDIGLMEDPEEVAKRAEIEKIMSAPINLSAVAKKAVDSAHHPAQIDVNPLLSSSVGSGDFSSYHATWDKHFKDTMKLDDDDDDDDDDEDDEEEEEEEE